MSTETRKICDFCGKPISDGADGWHAIDIPVFPAYYEERDRKMKNARYMTMCWKCRHMIWAMRHEEGEDE